eukprot:GILK01003528.1.p1 GENE.GILK01003528.1~~GILK01003528.1.p1  ORF type:complete len:327 (-),score=53.56 GILK01003528.1:256-1236(-)
MASYREQFQGLYAASFTPFRVDESSLTKTVVDTSRLEEYAKMLVKDGVAGVFVNGTAGESMSLSVSERKLLAEAWMDIAKQINKERADKPFKVLIHIGAQSLADCCELAKHAQSIQADGVGCMAPGFFKPRNIDALVQFLSVVAASAPELPFLYYHFPEMTGCSMPVHKVFEAAIPLIPNLAGAKFTGFDLSDMGRCLELCNRKYAFFFGREHNFLGAVGLGAICAIGVFYNMAADRYNAILHSASDLATSYDFEQARKHQIWSNDMTAVFDGFPELAVTCKAAFKLIKGIDMGPPRAPLTPLTADQEALLARQLQSVGFTLATNQ